MFSEMTRGVIGRMLHTCRIAGEFKYLEALQLMATKLPKLGSNLCTLRDAR